MNGIPFEDLDIAVAVEQRNFPEITERISRCSISNFRRGEDMAYGARSGNPMCCDRLFVASTSCGFRAGTTPSLTDWPDGRDVLAWLTDLA